MFAEYRLLVTFGQTYPHSSRMVSVRQLSFFFSFALAERINNSNCIIERGSKRPWSQFHLPLFVRSQ